MTQCDVMKTDHAAEVFVQNLDEVVNQLVDGQLVLWKHDVTFNDRADWRTSLSRPRGTKTFYLLLLSGSFVNRLCKRNGAACGVDRCGTHLAVRDSHHDEQGGVLAVDQSEVLVFHKGALGRAEK